MRYGSGSVQSFVYAPPEVRKAKCRYLMAIRCLRVEDLHRLLDYRPTRSTVSYVTLGRRKSRATEERIAAVLGTTRDQLFGLLPLDIWRVA